MTQHDSFDLTNAADLWSRIVRAEVVERLGAIGELTRSCVFMATVSNGTIAALTGTIDLSMVVSGHALQQPGRGVAALRDADLPALKRQVAAALAGHPPAPYEYRYCDTQGSERSLRCLLTVVDSADLPPGMQQPAVLGVVHLPAPEASPSRQLAEARLFGRVFQRWICAGAAQRPVVEEAIAIAAEALQIVGADSRQAAEAMLQDRAAMELRLASDVHDGMCQQLASAAGILSVVTAAVDRGDVTRAREQLEVGSGLVDEAMAASRAALSGLQPPAFDDAALPVALRRLAEKFAPTAVLYLDIDADVTLSEPARQHLLRIAQEALANVHKHADAGLVEVALLDLGSHVQLLVRDDGRGFSPRDRAAPGDGAFGLPSMHGRAALLGGRLDVASTPGSGTCLDLRVPKRSIR